MRETLKPNETRTITTLSLLRRIHAQRKRETRCTTQERENTKRTLRLPPPPKRRRRSSMSSSFGSNFATTSSSSNLSLMKLTPRTGICATALARMRYLSSLFVFFFSAIYASNEETFLLKNSSSTKTGHPIRRRTRDARSRRFTLCRKRKERRRRRQR